MDHLPIPDGADESQIRVPYYGGAYDEGPFMTYLERHGGDVYQLLDLARAVLQPHTVTDEVPGVDREPWLDVKFEHLIETLKSVHKNVNAGKDKVVAKLAALLVSAESRTPSPTALPPQGEASADQSLATGSKTTIYDVLKILDRDSKTMHQRGEMIAAEDCTTWYRRVILLARAISAPDSGNSQGLEQSQQILVAISKCSEPMPASTFYGDKPNKQVRSLFTTLQNWLFFGLLYDIARRVGIEFDTKDFINSWDNGMYLSTKRLPDFINAWKARETDHMEGRQARGMEIMSNLQWASKVAAEFERVVPSRGIGESSLSLCILILACTLQQQSSLIYRRGFVLSFTSAYLRRRFLAAEWCPNQVAAIEASFMLPWQYYIYSMGRDRPNDQFEDVHRHCTMSRCTVNQISKETYQVRHVSNNEGREYTDMCPICHIANGYRESAPRENFFDPDVNELVQIIEDGGIPLISIYDVNLEPYNNDPKIVRYDPKSMDYVAISHVWADGLGNPYSNSLHLCQIMFLGKTLTELGASRKNDSRLYFWIDTVCVPLEPSSARIRAIQSIINVFSQAKCTLVMTSDLRKLDTPSTKLETITRILVSNWTRRLWTYSEAMLSNRIAFKYSDGWVYFHNTLAELRDEAKQNPSWDFLGALQGVHASISVPWAASDTITDLLKDLPILTAAPDLDAVQCIANVRSLATSATKDKISPEHTRALAFMSLVQGTPWKMTSVAFDELICIAQLLKIDLMPILKLSPDRTEGLKLLLRIQHIFPRSIIFLDASHMIDPGFRWSPKSYLSDYVDQRDIEGLKVTRQLALLSTDGLVFEWPGIIFEITQPMYLKDSESTYFFTFPANADSQHADHTYKVLVQSRKETPPSRLYTTWKSMAIIFEAPAGLPLDEQCLASAVLVRLLRRTHEICYVQVVARVTIERMELNTGDNPMWTVDLQKEHNRILEHVEVLPRTQAWCLG